MGAADLTRLAAAARSQSRRSLLIPSVAVEDGQSVGRTDCGRPARPGSALLVSDWTIGISGLSWTPNARSHWVTRGLPTQRPFTPGRRSATHTSLAIGGGLDAVQLGVLAARRHERVVRADLDDAGAVEHDDEIGHPHGGEAV